MNTFRNNPDGEENQNATRDTNREIFALKMIEKNKELKGIPMKNKPITKEKQMETTYIFEVGFIFVDGYQTYDQVRATSHQEAKIKIMERYNTKERNISSFTYCSRFNN